MNQLVADASVAAKWIIPEKHSEKAARLLDGRRPLLVPDLIYAEYGNIIWKQHGRRNLEAAEAVDRVNRLLRVPLQVYPAKSLLPRGVELAVQTRRTVYDCLYLALAERQACEMITADEKLVNALSGGPLARYVRWIGGM